MKLEELDKFEMTTMYNGKKWNVIAIYFNDNFVDLQYQNEIEYGVPIEDIEDLEFKNKKSIALML